MKQQKLLYKRNKKISIKIGLGKNLYTFASYFEP